MKIMLISTSTAAGGAEKVLCGLACALAKTQTVRVISIYPKGYYARKMEESGVNVTSFNSQKRNFIKNIFKLKKEITAFKPDVVHAFLYSAIQMARIAADGSFKLFTTPHSNYGSIGYLRRIVDAALKSKDTLSLAESESTKEFLLINQRYSSKKVLLTQNSAAPEFEKDTNKRKIFRDEQKIKDNFVFLCAARFNPVKGHKYLLDAFALLREKNKNAVLILAGDGEGQKEAELKAISLGIREHVKFLGFCEDMTLPLNGADAFVMASESESLPLAAIEAASTGLPLILTDVGGNSQICEHGKNGFLLPPKDSVLMACMMQEVMENKKLYKDFSAHSLKKSLQFKKDFASEHLKIYNN